MLVGRMAAKGITDLIIIDGNSICAECRSLNISHASSKYGVFLCTPCSNVHRFLVGCHSLVKPITVGPWSQPELDLILAMGNNKANELYERHLPPFYRRPWEGCIPCLREQFILAKYDRQEFLEAKRQDLYNTLYKKGRLMKKLRDEDKYLERTFELSAEDNYLRYFVKESQKEAKNTLDLDKLNATFLDDSVPNVPNNCLQITYIIDGATRNIFVYSAEPREVVDWYHTIRCAKYRRLVLTLSGMNQSGGDDLADRITYDHLIEGHLEKTGPKTTEAWRKRYCRVGRRRLMYSEKQLDAFCKGEIALGERSEGFAAFEGLPETCRKSHSSGVPFTLKTPYRNFLFLAPSDENRRRWVAALNSVIDTPMTLQQRNELATAARKKSGRLF